MKRVLASVSLGKEVTVSSAPVLREVGPEGGEPGARQPAVSTHSPEKGDPLGGRNMLGWPLCCWLKGLCLYYPTVFLYTKPLS